ncbi:MAG: major facilitator superfamily permease [Bacteroidota bacterium]|jgi:predicted MFS family arabinose efflux permease|nr:major facilitator superfamily permease [Bacteroidota bacterium]
MSRKGFSDEEIALFITFRFLGVFILAVPIGNFLKGRVMKPFFYISSILVPLFGLGIILCIHLKLTILIYVSLLLWGASFTFMQIPITPYILRNEDKAHHTSGIALSYSTWSFAGIISGVVIAILDRINPLFFDEEKILILFSLLGFGGIYFMSKVDLKEEINDTKTNPIKHKKEKNDWNLIFKGLIPTLIIATGAGLTIPFISLFFDKVHHMGKGNFSFVSAVAAILVAWGAMMVPRIKDSIGYKVAIPTTQSLAVISLIALATTQFYSQYSIAVYIAIACYLLRQPLMNMAGPMTSELVMNYVGERNREITSALTAAIWSGSWVISGYMVKVMFHQGYAFVNVFLITSALYAFGVLMYYFLILDYGKREKQGLI